MFPPYEDASSAFFMSCLPELRTQLADALAKTSTQHPAANNLIGERRDAEASRFAL